MRQYTRKGAHGMCSLICVSTTSMGYDKPRCGCGHLEYKGSIGREH